ncbi:ketopantoate reductase family protein [Rhizobium sp. WYJ-E13]|uniref:ketopantoate reductase family protein n=1 Tax=Rhizobium sp. WYJ-E13 TaxID=2849093 RepID=UPI001C1EF09F|nr:2-dehydropantoate 2-reductase [Rhizobium sp. WYJ-E13]QWW72299.1 2-dehydropantoate 2-reductase [Rhizobium sp. WYJ-E13]
MERKSIADFGHPRICVAGAGAIGLTLAARLKLAGFAVSIVARGASLTAILNEGIRLFDREGEHQVQVEAGYADDLSLQDIIFLCPKSQDLPTLASSVQQLIGPDTMIVPVINGIPWWYFERLAGTWEGRQIEAVDPDNVLKGLLPSAQIIGTTTMITAERLKPGTARTINALQMTVGELDDQVSERVTILADILKLSGIETRVTSRIRDAVWTKVVRNLISNPVTAITGATLRENFGNGDLAGISRQMLFEVLPVIAAFGARIEVDPDAILSSGRKMGDVKTSMLQDLERGSPLELAAICDAVLELGRLHHIAQPVTQAITALARFKSVGTTRQPKAA